MIKQAKSIHVAGMVITLVALWLLLSGHYTPLVTGLGLLSVLLVAWISIRMDLLEYDQPDVFRQTVRSVPYGFWLLKEIVLANIDVIKRILDPTLPISPRLVDIPSTQVDELARVAYANSITLTPGTISIDVEGKYIEVHTLSENGVEGLMTGEMDKRITEVEAKGYA
ncbi:MAG: Na+/H+ antiporter subunit E [Gammaproteobacteria bacterium]